MCGGRVLTSLSLPFSIFMPFMQMSVFLWLLTMRCGTQLSKKRMRTRFCFQVCWKCPDTTAVPAICPGRHEGQVISETQKKNMDLGRRLWHGSNQTVPLVAERLSLADPNKKQSQSSGFLHWGSRRWLATCYQLSVQWLTGEPGVVSPNQVLKSVPEVLQ